MLLTLLAAAAAAATPIDCSSSAGIEAPWRATVEAYRSHNLAEAKVGAESLMAACGDRPFAGFPRMLLADIALSEGDNDRALAALGPGSRPAPPPLGPYTSHIALRAWQGKKDTAAFADERSRLVAATVAGLSAPGNRFRSEQVDAFDAGGIRVTAFRTSFGDNSFQRHFVFVLAPTEPFAMPGTMMLSTDAASSLLGGGQVYFLDEYGCGGHATLEIFERRKPTYKALKAKVLARLAGKLQPTSSIAGGGACAFPDYVSPGFAPE